jgi:hypothetical protein
MLPIRMDSFYKKKSAFLPPRLPTREDSFRCKSSLRYIFEECAGVAHLKSVQGSPLRECLTAFMLLGGRSWSFRGESKSLHLQVDDIIVKKEEASSLSEEVRTGFFLPVESSSPESTANTSGGKKPRVGALDVELDMIGEQGKRILVPQQRRLSSSRGARPITAPVA